MIDLSGHVLVLDLDDTLYLERDFVHSGFAAVGCWMETEHGIPDIAEACTALFDDGLRGTVFDRVLEGLGPAGEGIAVAQMVEVYRAHKPDIALAPDALRLLRRIHGQPSALITDGPLVTQQNKIDALGLDRYIGKMVVTAALPNGCGKPHPMPFELVEQWSGKSGAEHVYIADNPAKDFIAPRRLGWLTVQIERPGRIHLTEAPTAAHAAVQAIETLDAIILR